MTSSSNFDRTQSEPSIFALTLILGAIASLCVDAMQFATGSVSIGLLRTSVWMMAIVAARWIPKALRHSMIWYWSPAVGLIAPFILATLAGRHLMLDGGLSDGCRNAMFLSMAGPRDLKRLGFAAAISLLLLATVAAQLPSTWLLAMLIPYLSAGMLWLHLLQRVRVSSVEVRPSMFWMVGGLAGGVCSLGTVWLVHAAPIARGRTGWFASSGGLRNADDSATAGLGNGQDEVAGSRNAQSVGYDQSNTFMNSEHAGLYDAFVEAYGEPVKKSEFAKMQMLHIQDIKYANATNVEDYRAGKQFSLARHAPPPAGEAKSHAADALLYGEGSLPQHLRLEAFDQFDGVTWTAIATSPRSLDDTSATGESGWFHVGPAVVPLTDPLHVTPSSVTPFGHESRLRVRIGQLKSETLPLAAGTQAMQVGRVKKLSLFAWKQPEVLRMDRREVPAGTVVESDVGSFDPTLITPWSWPAALKKISDSSADDAELSAIARRWTSGAEEGWPQIEAIIRQLRERCTLTTASDTSTSSHPMLDFLNKTHHGPDYLFASSAAALLRKLGYATRLAAGYYANPQRYDASIGQTPLTNRDLHTWAEVLVCNRWVVVESSPGYALAGSGAWWHVSPMGVWATLARSTGRFVVAHLWTITSMLSCTVAIRRYRLSLIDLLLTAHWRLRAFASPSNTIPATVSLLKNRARAAGIERSESRPIARWLTDDCLRRSSIEMTNASRFSQMVNEFAFADVTSQRDSKELAKLCRKIACLTTIACLAQSVRADRDRRVTS